MFFKLSLFLHQLKTKQCSIVRVKMKDVHLRHLHRNKNFSSTRYRKKKKGNLTVSSEQKKISKRIATFTRTYINRHND